jgi:hypothetical protein
LFDVLDESVVDVGCVGVKEGLLESINNDTGRWGFDLDISVGDS